MWHRPIGVAVAPWAIVLSVGLITAGLGSLLLFRARSHTASVSGIIFVLAGAVLQVLSVVSYIRWLRLTR